MTHPRPAPIRPLGVGEILDGAVRLVRDNARGTLTISVPFAIARAGLAALLQYAAIEATTAQTLTVIGGLLLGVALGTVLTGLLAPLFSSALLGARMTAGQAVRRVGGRAAWRLAVLALLVTVAEGVGLVAFGVGGVYLWGIWAVAAPALVLERTTVRGALSRTRRLVEGTFWRVWGIRALGWVLTTVLGFFIALPFELLAGYVTGANLFDPAGGVTHPGLYVTIVAVGSLLSGVIVAPIAAAVDVLLYTDLRMRKEGMDIVLALPPWQPQAVPPVTAW
ncbi:MAG: hypothetical protein ABR571_06715 [Jatrophihabitans sp.]|uniref:hypothetical protein n=1 Tax=Jatrophihabitans sp. TaxID=1932789 RepID=UPI00390D197D